MKFLLLSFAVLLILANLAAGELNFTSACDAEHPCENGGTCTGDPIKYCICPPFTYGDRCNIVLLCEINFCEAFRMKCEFGNETQCVYDIEKGFPEIQCKDPNKIIKDEKCVDCTCENGKCVKDTTGRSFCKCEPPFASYSSGICKECNCGSGSNCTFVTSLFGPSKACSCRKGYKEVSGICTDPCTKNPCRNGGTCQDTYQCSCPPKYTGAKCEKKKGCECENGKCVKEFSEEVCRCPQEYVKVHDTKCRSCNCGKGFGCTLTWLGLFTKCLCGVTHMEVDGTCVEVCETSPCKNGGTCVDGRYCKCPSGFRGVKCEWEDSCLPNPCQNNGTCAYLKDDFYCQCKSPYAGKTCEKISLCESNPCQHGGTCTDTRDNFTCQCQLPYYGRTCEKSFQDLNVCRNSGIVIAKMRTSFSPNFYSNGIFLPQLLDHVINCNCSYPYSGRFCEKPPSKCDSSDRCLNNGLCVHRDSSVDCICPSPYAGNKCEIDMCNPNPCKNGGTCSTHGWNSVYIQKNVSTYCECKPPFFGEFCELDPCSSNPCMNEGKCDIVGKNSTCDCKKPFFGEYCENDPCTSNPCMNNGKCKIVGENSTCECEKPFFGDFCEIDPCTSNPCVNGGKCKVVGENATCECLEPFFGDRCELDRCTSNPCMNGGKCKIVGIKSICECKKPFFGKLCETNPCTSNPCMNGGNCKIVDETVVCECNKPFFGQRCEISPCTSNPCMNGGNCKILGSSSRCECVKPFSGKRCEIEESKEPGIILPAVLGSIVCTMFIMLCLIACVINRKLSSRAAAETKSSTRSLSVGAPDESSSNKKMDHKNSIQRTEL